MLISPKLELPAFIKRSLEAYEAGDPITVAEAFANNATLSVQLDDKLCRRLGLPEIDPIVTRNAIEIMQYYASELSVYEVTHFEVLHVMAVGRELATICEWGVKLRENGTEATGRCHNLWTLDQAGRKIIRGKTMSKIITSPKLLVVN